MSTLCSRSFLKTMLFSSAIVLIQSCTEQPTSTVESTPDTLREKSLKELVKNYQGKNAKKAEVAKGIDEMLEGHYAEASTQFNTILNTDPSNATVHLLNGINYQLQSRDGDISQQGLAEAAFVQASKFDPASVLANIHLGQIKKTAKDYSGAQEAFAAALLIDPRNPVALYELATTSYLMGDLKTALPIIEQYLKVQPNRLEGWQSAAVVKAACGDVKGAQAAINRLVTLAKGDGYKVEQTQHRVADWKKLYDGGLITLAQADVDLTATNSLDSASNVTISTDPTVDAAAPVGIEANAAKTPSANQPLMIVLDGMILRFSQDIDSNKGSNILDKFALIIAPGTHLKARMKGRGTNPSDFNGLSAGINASNTSINGLAGLGATITGGSQNPFAVSRIFTQGIGFSTIQYGLNIANVNRETIQIINRPSITTILGQKGEFFSGSEYLLGLEGQYGGTVTRTPVGTQLTVTPTSYDPTTDTVTLEIKMYGSVTSLEGFTTNAKQFNELYSSRVLTTVNMKMGETLMLAGIQTRTDQQIKSGFPILEDIIGLQYLFSNATTKSTRNQITFMLTPRLAADAKKLTQAYFTNEKPNERHTLTALQMRNKDWFSTPFPNWVVHFKMMESLYREFRTGDVPDVHWYAPKEVDTSLNEIKSFFYY